LPIESRTAAFYRLWTRKEAALKALGTGIAAGLDGFSVLLDLISESIPGRGMSTCLPPLLLRDLPLRWGWSGALATETAITDVRLHALSPADAQGNGL
jgi:4'-phosphopantetheinyl transferase